MIPISSHSPFSQSKRDAIKKIATCAVLTGSGALLSACSKEEKASFKSIDLTGADYAKDFALSDQNGQLRSIKDFTGKVVVVFFGFTQCPDCNLSGVMERIAR